VFQSGQELVAKEWIRIAGEPIPLVGGYVVDAFQLADFHAAIVTNRVNTGTGGINTMTDSGLLAAGLPARRVPAGRGGGSVDGEVSVPGGAMVQALRLPAVIRSVQGDEAQDSRDYGLEFRIVDPRDTLALHGFVYGQIAKRVP